MEQIRSIYAEKLGKQNVRKRRNVKLIRAGMWSKVEDAKFDWRNVKRQFRWASIEYARVTRRNSYVDWEFRDLMQFEVGKVWECGKSKNTIKVNSLVNRWMPNRDEFKDIMNVKYSDTDLDGIETEPVEKKVITYGGLEVSSNMEAALKMHPKFMMWGKIDVNKMEVEFDKGVTKARYALMNINDKSGNHENENAEDDITKNEVYDIEKRAADYANVRATDLPTVQRFSPPKPARMNQEIAMQSLKEKLLRRTIQFKEEKCNQNGWLNEKNVSKNVVNGFKEIREKVKAGEMVVFQSDKSSQLTADTVNNNREDLEAHTAGDIVVDGKRVKDIEENCNQHLKQFNKMFSVGAAHGQGKKNSTCFHCYQCATSTKIPSAQRS